MDSAVCIGFLGFRQISDQKLLRLHNCYYSLLLHLLGLMEQSSRQTDSIFSRQELLVMWAALIRFFRELAWKFGFSMYFSMVPYCPAQREPFKKWRLKKQTLGQNSSLWGKRMCVGTARSSLTKPLGRKNESGDIRYITVSNVVKENY